MNNSKLWAVALALLGLTACDDGSSPGTASLRVIHLSPDAPAVDVYVDGAAAITDLAYKESTEFLAVEAGSADLAVRAAGMPSSTPVIAANGVALADGESYTVVAYDNLANIMPMVLEDDRTGIPAGQIRVRAIHAAAGVGTVDLWNIPASGAPTKIADDLAFGAATGFLDLPAAAYTIGVDVNNDAVPDLQFATPPLAAGTYANVFAVKDSTGVKLVAQLESGATATIAPLAAKVRVAHLSPNAPAVDVWVDSGTAAAFTNLAFQSGTAAADLEAGPHSFYVRANPSTSSSANVITVSDLPLVSGFRYTAAAYGLLGNGTTPITALALRDDAIGLASGSIRVNVAHTAAGVGQVDVWNVTPGSAASPLVTDLDYGEVAPSLDIPAGQYRVGIDVNNDATPDLTFQLPSLAAGTVANVFPVKNGSAVYLLVQLDSTTGALAKIDPLP